MNQITAAQFRAAVGFDPAVASKFTEPVEVTDYCDMTGSAITHLSPLLHFTGKNTDPNTNGNCADFSHCKFLKVAEGRFSGAVKFSYSGIEKIGDLSCGKDNKGNKGNSADFWRCHSLKIAEGKFEGYVRFFGSNIERIGDLSCGNNNDGIRLSVGECPNLKSIPFTFNPKEIAANPKLIENLTETRAFIRKKREETEEVMI